MLGPVTTAKVIYQLQRKCSLTLENFIDLLRIHIMKDEIFTVPGNGFCYKLHRRQKVNLGLITPPPPPRLKEESSVRQKRTHEQKGTGEVI